MVRVHSLLSEFISGDNILTLLSGVANFTVGLVEKSLEKLLRRNYAFNEE